MTERPQRIGAEAALYRLDGRGWRAVDGRDAISKTFKFADFSEAFAWMTRVAMLAEKLDHHPEWSNVYDRVDVVLTTHSAGGVSTLDVEMAQRMDEMSPAWKSAA